jgi:hypothetical protein
MNYLKCVLAGIAEAMIAIVVLAAVLLGIAYWLIEPVPRSLVTAVIVSPNQLLLAAGIGFALGFWRSVRKQRHRTGALPG